MPEKKTYTFVVATGITLHVEVKATSLAEAVKKAQSASVMSLCHYCARSEKGEWRTSGELDCEPQMAPLEDAYAFVDDESVDIDLAEAKRLWGGSDE